jgi:hypothetical protein
MTGLELQDYFGIQLNKFQSNIDLDTRDIFYWLNQAQDKMIHDARKEYDRDRRIGDLLRPFSKRSSLPTIGDTYTDNDIAPLPEDYRYPVALSGRVLYNKGGITIVGEGVSRTVSGEHTQRDRLIRLVQKDDIYRLLLDPFHKTRPQEPLATISGDTITVYNSPEFIVSVVHLDYLRQPAHVSRQDGTELPPHHHHTLVEMGVNLYLSNTRNLKEKVQRETPLTQ